jgi:proteasome accessory factor B
MARTDQLQRSFRVLRLLARPGGASLPELQQVLGVSLRTVRRDVEALEACGAPLHQDADEWPPRWQVRASWVDRAGLDFTLDELIALHALAVEVGAAGDGPVTEALASVLAKVRSTVPQQMLARLAGLRQLIRAAPRAGRRAPALGHVLRTVLEAVETCEELRIDYRSRTRLGRAWRVIHPLALAVRGAALYIVARDAIRGDVRKYLTSRIEAAELTGRPFDRPEAFDVDEYFGDSFGVHGGVAVDIRLRFEPEVAAYVRERRWHASQALHEQADGRLVLSMRVSGFPEIKSWVQSFGAAVTVLEPAALAEAVAAEARTVAARATKGRLVAGLVERGRAAARSGRLRPR